MTDNPLLDRQPQRPGRVTVGMLDDLAAKLNGYRWVKDSGQDYYVGRRVNEKNEVEHFLDRKIAPHPTGGG